MAIVHGCTHPTDGAPRVIRGGAMLVGCWDPLTGRPHSRANAMQSTHPCCGGYSPEAVRVTPSGCFVHGAADATYQQLVPDVCRYFYLDPGMTYSYQVLLEYVAVPSGMYPQVGNYLRVQITDQTGYAYTEPPPGTGPILYIGDGPCASGAYDLPLYRRYPTPETSPCGSVHVEFLPGGVSELAGCVEPDTGLLRFEFAPTPGEPCYYETTLRRCYDAATLPIVLVFNAGTYKPAVEIAGVTYIGQWVAGTDSEGRCRYTASFAGLPSPTVQQTFRWCNQDVPVTDVIVGGIHRPRVQVGGQSHDGYWRYDAATDHCTAVILGPDRQLRYPWCDRQMEVVSTLDEDAGPEDKPVMYLPIYIPCGRENHGVHYYRERFEGVWTYDAEHHLCVPHFTGLPACAEERTCYECWSLHDRMYASLSGYPGGYLNANGVVELTRTTCNLEGAIYHGVRRWAGCRPWEWKYDPERQVYVCVPPDPAMADDAVSVSVWVYLYCDGHYRVVLSSVSAAVYGWETVQYPPPWPHGYDLSQCPSAENPYYVLASIQPEASEVMIEKDFCRERQAVTFPSVLHAYGGDPCNPTRHDYMSDHVPMDISVSLAF